MTISDDRVPGARPSRFLRAGPDGTREAVSGFPLIKLTSSYTISEADCFSELSFSNTAAVTLTLPSNLPLGFEFYAVQAGTGAVNIATAGGAPALISGDGMTALPGRHTLCKFKVVSDTNDLSSWRITVQPSNANVGLFIAPNIATRRHIALLGNSIDANANNYGSHAAIGSNYLSSGYASWMLALCDQCVKLPKGNVFGYAGKTVGEFADPSTYGLVTGGPHGLAGILALSPKPDIVVVGCATNNIVRSDGQQTLDFIINGGTIGGVVYMGYKQIFQALTQAGIKVIARPTGPRSDQVLTATQFGTMFAINRWLREIARRDIGVSVPSYIQDLVDPTSALFGPRTGVLNLTDLLHPAIGSGCFYMGRSLAGVIKSLVPPVDMLALNAAPWSASNPYGNMTPNLPFVGTGGTVTNFAGVAPTSWQDNKPAGDSSQIITGANVASTVNANFTAHQWTYSGSFTGAGSGSAPDITHVDRMLGAAAAANFTAGDIVEGFVGFEIDAGFTGMCCPSLQIRDAGNVTYNEAMYPANGGEFPGVAITGVLWCPEITITSTMIAAGAISLVPKVFRKTDVTGSVNCAGVIRWTRPTLLKTLPY